MYLTIVDKGDGIGIGEAASLAHAVDEPSGGAVTEAEGEARPFAGDAGVDGELVALEAEA